MSGKGNPFYMSTFKNYLNFVKIIASYYENKVITNVICIVTLYEYNIVYCHLYCHSVWVQHRVLSPGIITGHRIKKKFHQDMPRKYMVINRLNLMRRDIISIDYMQGSKDWKQNEAISKSRTEISLVTIYKPQHKNLLLLVL